MMDEKRKHFHCIFKSLQQSENKVFLSNKFSIRFDLKKIASYFNCLFPAGSFFPGVTGGINSHYTQVNQKVAIANIVGQAQADRYITSTQFLSRGHLAAMTDFVFATGQRASFFFINCAPQWQPFNAGNWNWLEQVNNPW